MSDWGKVILEFMQGKPAMILLICVAIIAFVPFECLEQVKREYAIWVTLAGVFSVSSVSVNLLFWAKDLLSESVTKQQEEASAVEAIWGRFTRLHPKMQMFLIRLFFSGHMSETVRLKDPMVATLRNQGFLIVINDGMVSSDGSGELVVTVMISQPMLDFMNKYSEEFRKQADRILSASGGFERRSEAF